VLKKSPISCKIKINLIQISKKSKVSK